MRSARALFFALLLGAATAGAQVPAAPPMSASAVRAAASAVAADPLLAGTEKTKSLRFKDNDKKKPEKVDDPNWWLTLLGNLSGGLRVAMWLLGAGLLIWILLQLRDWLRSGGDGRALPALAPTHVGTLDIRPESLPADIGAAARELLARGEQRAALSLLYRGALSRLVHGHGVAIRAASTERECLALAAPRLAPTSHVFLTELVAGWQAVAYARRELPTDSLEQLCQGFDAQLPAAPATPGAAA